MPFCLMLIECEVLFFFKPPFPFYPFLLKILQIKTKDNYLEE